MSDTIDTTLRVPIQINGGDSNPDSLLERELYITSSGRIKYGTGSGVGDITAVNADTVGTNATPIKIDTTAETATNMIKIGTIYGGHRDKDATPGVDTPLNGLKGLPSLSDWNTYKTNLTLENANTFYWNDDSNESFLRYFTLYASYVYGCKLYSCELGAVGKMTLTKGVNGTYGPTLPTTGVAGQIFFKI